jgi:hypothetical protein
MSKNSPDFLEPKSILQLANQMLDLEKIHIKSWRKNTPFQRGKDLTELIQSTHPRISEEELIHLASWVDIAISCGLILQPLDGFNVLMTTQEALNRLLNLAFDKNSSALEDEDSLNWGITQSFADSLEGIYEWSGQFGCLLTEGSKSDIGTWYSDNIFDQLLKIGALEESD